MFSTGDKIFAFYIISYSLHFDLESPLWYPGGPVLVVHGGEKAELWLEQLRLGRWWQLVQWEGRAGSELCGRRRLGQRLGGGGHGHNLDQRNAPPSWRGAVGQRLQLGQQQHSQGGQSEWSVRQRVPEKHSQHCCHHGEYEGRQIRQKSKRWMV